MQVVPLSKVRIDEVGQLRVTPTTNPSKMFQFAYRADLGVYWDIEQQCFYTPAPGVISYTDWYVLVLDTANSEFGCSLRITEHTEWENVPLALKQAIRLRAQNYRWNPKPSPYG